VEYYIASDCDEIMRLKGFDHVVGMGDNPLNLCGFYDKFNNIIYSNSKKGECYEHEITRLINNFFSGAHGLLINGLSDYFIEDNSKLGFPLTEHFKRMDNYLNLHPEIDLSHLDSFYSMDNVTSPSYLLGILICQLILEKGGLPLLKKGMKSTPTDETLYKFIETEIGVKQTDLNETLREMIYRYSRENIKKIISPNSSNIQIMLWKRQIKAIRLCWIFLKEYQKVVRQRMQAKDPLRMIFCRA
jgi:hypothetical protein